MGAPQPQRRRRCEGRWLPLSVALFLASQLTTLASAAVRTVVAINAGGPTVQTADGTVYEQDRYFHPQLEYQLHDADGRAVVEHAEAPLSSAQLLQTERQCPLIFYALPIPYNAVDPDGAPSPFVLTLHFVDLHPTHALPPPAVDILVNDIPVRQNLTLAGHLVAHQESFELAIQRGARSALVASGTIVPFFGEVMLAVVPTGAASRDSSSPDGSIPLRPVQISALHLAQGNLSEFEHQMQLASEQAQEEEEENWSEPLLGAWSKPSRTETAQAMLAALLCGIGLCHAQQQSPGKRNPKKKPRMVGRTICRDGRETPSPSVQAKPNLEVEQRANRPAAASDGREKEQLSAEPKTKLKASDGREKEQLSAEPKTKLKGQRRNKRPTTASISVQAPSASARGKLKQNARTTGRTDGRRPQCERPTTRQTATRSELDGQAQSTPTKTESADQRAVLDRSKPTFFSVSPEPKIVAARLAAAAAIDATSITNKNSRQAKRKPRRSNGTGTTRTKRTDEKVHHRRSSSSSTDSVSSAASSPSDPPGSIASSQHEQPSSIAGVAPEQQVAGMKSCADLRETTDVPRSSTADELHEAAAQLRVELAALRVSELKRLATTAYGWDQAAMDAIDDSTDPKAALIELLTSTDAGEAVCYTVAHNDDSIYADECYEAGNMDCPPQYLTQPYFCGDMYGYGMMPGAWAQTESFPAQHGPGPYLSENESNEYTDTAAVDPNDYGGINDALATPTSEFVAAAEKKFSQRLQRFARATPAESSVGVQQL